MNGMHLKGTFQEKNTVSQQPPI